MDGERASAVAGAAMPGARRRGSPSDRRVRRAAVTSPNPASASIVQASSRPHTVPSPAPPCASETVMQCSVLMPYSSGAIGLPMLSSSLLAALMSIMTNTRPGGSRAAPRPERRPGRPGRGSRRRRTPRRTAGRLGSAVTSRTSNVTLDRPDPRLPRGRRSTASVEMSYPRNVERGYARGQQVRRVTGAAADVGDPDAGGQPLGQARDERDDTVAAAGRPSARATSRP